MNDPGGAHSGLIVVGELFRELGVPHMVCGSLDRRLSSKSSQS